MNFVQFGALIRYETKTNSTTFSDTDILMFANIYKDDIAAMITTEIGEDYFGTWFVRDLKAGQREYNIPPEMMSRVQYSQVKLNGTDFTRLNETNLSLYQKPVEETDITTAYAGRDAEFMLWGKTMYIMSEDAITDVVEGLKIRAIVFPATFPNLTSTEDISNNPTQYEHGFPRQFHELLARRVAIAYKSSKDRPIPLSEKEQMYEIDLERQIVLMRDENMDRNIIPSIPYDDGSNY